jgi:chromosomal replication initiation ATPase DnaA
MKEDSFDPEPKGKDVLKDAIYKFLRQFYNESDSEKITVEFMKNFYRSVSTLSLDDLERLATSYLEDEKTN